MERIHIVSSRDKEIHFFKDSDLKKFLIKEKIKGSLEYVNIKICNYEIVHELSGKEYSEIIIKENLELENKELQEIYFLNFEKFYKNFKDLAENSRIKKDLIILFDFNLNNKEELKKIIRKNLDYFLYCVSSDVEWYKSLLSVYNIKEIKKSHRRAFFKKNGDIWSIENCKTSEISLTNFEIAKENLS